MNSSAADHAAIEWARTVTPARYKKHRDELDRLILAPLPHYDSAVMATIDNFGRAVQTEREAYDLEHSVDLVLRPWRIGWAKRVLFWVAFFGVVGSLVIFVPVGRIGGWEVPIQNIIPAAAVLFMIGVAASLLRQLPWRPGYPSVRGLSWMPAVCGVLLIALSVSPVMTDDRVSPAWLALVAAGTLASAAQQMANLVAARRHPELAAQAKTIEEDRLNANADRLKAQADKCADQLEADFRALSTREQDLVMSTLESATAQLRARHIVGTPTPDGARLIGQRATGYHRPLFPGMLILEKRVQQLWKPSFSEPRDARTVNWFIVEYLPK